MTSSSTGAISRTWSQADGVEGEDIAVQGARDADALADEAIHPDPPVRPLPAVQPLQPVGLVLDRDAVTNGPQLGDRVGQLVHDLDQLAGEMVADDVLHLA